MARRNKIYEGKAKILYEGPEPGTIVQYFKDDATACTTDAEPGCSLTLPLKSPEHKPTFLKYP